MELKKIQKQNLLIDNIKTIIYYSNSLLEHLENNGKFILMKNFKQDKAKLLDIPYIFDKDKYDTLTLSEFISKYRKEVLNFTDTLEKNFNSDELLFLRKNLKTLKIYLHDYMTYNGLYEPFANKIILKEKNYPSTLYHELFHMASTKKRGSKFVCGFHCFTLGISMGTSLNEGYTEIMANRYFNTNIYNSSYSNEIKYFDIIEEVIGREKLEKLYINANLAGLIKELEKYKDEKEIISFIINADDVLKHVKRNNDKEVNTYDKIRKEDMTNKIIDINIFLSSLYFKKNNLKDLTQSIDTNNHYNEMYMINDYMGFKNIYIASLVLYNSKSDIRVIGYDNLRRLYEIIGYDVLERVCFEKGISSLVNYLIKYTNLDEVYRYLDLLNDSLSPFNNINLEKERRIEEFNFGLMVSKSGIIDDINVSIDTGLQKEYKKKDLFKNYKYIIKFCIENNCDFIKNSVFLDNDDISRLYEIVGIQNMLKYYVNGDVDSFRDILNGYDIDKIMHIVDSNKQDLKEYLEKLKKEEMTVNKCK